MALTLTQTAQLTKRALLGSTILFFLIIAFVIGYKIWYYSYYLPHKPPVLPKPDTKFGVLPPPNYQESSASASNYSYSLDTTTGGLPTDIPNIIKVYFVPQLGTTLLAPDKAKALAGSFSFDIGPQAISQTQYRFIDEGGGEMIIDLNSDNFHFSRNASSSATLNPTMDDQSKIVDDFKNFLDSKGLLQSDLKTGRSKVYYDQPSPSNASSAQVTIWPDDLDSLEIVTPTYNYGLITATVTKYHEETSKYTSLNYTYYSPDPQNVSTYPIKTPDQAFTDLKNGLADVVITPPTPQVSITSVKLAYFESDVYSPYIEPVYVFEGDNFVAYVNAITADFLSTKSSGTPSQ